MAFELMLPSVAREQKRLEALRQSLDDGLISVGDYLTAVNNTRITTSDQPSSITGSLSTFALSALVFGAVFLMREFKR